MGFASWSEPPQNDCIVEGGERKREEKGTRSEEGAGEVGEVARREEAYQTASVAQNG
jgi:hypothetical protein